MKNVFPRQCRSVAALPYHTRPSVLSFSLPLLSPLFSLSLSLSLWLPPFLSLALFFPLLSVSPLFCLSLSLSVCFSVCLSVCLSVRLSVCLPLSTNRKNNAHLSKIELKSNLNFSLRRCDYVHDKYDNVQMCSATYTYHRWTLRMLSYAYRKISNIRQPNHKT